MKLEQICEVSEDKKHAGDIETIDLYGERLFSGADDGIVKIWSTKDLQFLHEFKAHDYAVNHLLVMNDRLLSASMDQTIKSWQLDTWKLIATFVGHEESPRRLATDGEFIFCGDDKGEVIKWSKDGEPLARYPIIEEVWDLYIQNPYIYTVRDRGLTISETIPNSMNYSVVRSMEGRAPFFIRGSDLLMLSQSGTVINHFANEPPSYEYIQEFKGHERIITVLTGYKDYILSSGYDEKLFVWDLKEGQLLATVPLKGCPIAIKINNEGDVFIAGPNGHIIKMNLVS